MDDAFRMCRIQSIGDLDRKLDDLNLSYSSARKVVHQCLAFEPLHNDEVASFMLPHIVNSTNVWMVKCSCGAGFPRKAVEGMWVSSQFFRQELQGNLAF